MKQEFKLTQENLDKLKDELEYLKTVRMQEVAEHVPSATCRRTPSTMRRKMSRAR